MIRINIKRGIGISGDTLFFVDYLLPISSISLASTSVTKR
ncbi:hypothetical protein C21_01270 [Arenibacter sp. NBRC 103722]|nr:hypothetical protein C21_01270 [Arenibacter sp. NBRC 103722]